jgi:hypothetical protein
VVAGTRPAHGSQPIGRGIGPALEARDVIAVTRGDHGAPHDLRERAILLAAGYRRGAGWCARPASTQQFESDRSRERESADKSVVLVCTLDRPTGASESFSSRGPRCIEWQEQHRRVCAPIMISLPMAPALATIVAQDVRLYRRDGAAPARNRIAAGKRLRAGFRSRRWPSRRRAMARDGARLPGTAPASRRATAPCCPPRSPVRQSCGIG